LVGWAGFALGVEQLDHILRGIINTELTDEHSFSTSNGGRIIQYNSIGRLVVFQRPMVVESCYVFPSAI